MLVSSMCVRTMIASQPAVGTASSEAKQAPGTLEMLEVLRRGEVVRHDDAHT